MRLEKKGSDLLGEVPIFGHFYKGVELDMFSFAHLVTP